MQKKYIPQFLLVMLGTALYFMANIQRVAIPGAIFDTLQTNLSASAAVITGLGASFMYIYAIGQLIVGVLIARFGGFKIISAGSIIFTIGGLMFPFANSVFLLYLSRALVGFGSATFYLSLVSEIRKIVHKNNYSLVLSIVLLISYLGGIIANAPLVLFVEKMSVTGVFAGLGIIAFVLSILFLFIKFFVPSQKEDKTISFNTQLYRNVLKKRSNINIFVFAALNYGMYYVLQTVIGKKFLEDFCQIPTMKAALVLSAMSGLYAIAGPCIAAMSRAALNRRAAFMKFSALNTFFIFLVTLICLLINYKTSLLALFLCLISFWASLSPLLIPLLHDTNEQKEASVAVGMMTSGFYFVVGILGNLTGWILNIYTPDVKEGAAIVYSNSAYSVIFLCLVILSLISLKTAFSIKESPQTRRYIKMCGLIMRHKTHGDEIYSGSGH